MGQTSIILGNNTLTGVETLKLTDATDTTAKVDFTYSATPSGTINVKLGDTTLTGVNEISVLGIDSTYKSFGYIAPQSAVQVTLTANDVWNSSSLGSIYVYEGQDDTGQVLLSQNPANKSAYPINVNVSGGYLYIVINGGYIMGYVSSNDYTLNTIKAESEQYVYLVSGINANGTISFNISDFND